MFTVKVDNSRFGAPLAQLVQRLGDPAEVLTSIGSLLENNVRNRTALAVDPNGARWQPWADATLESYPYPGTEFASVEGPDNGRLLDRDGTMPGSLADKVEEVSAGTVVENDQQDAGQSRRSAHNGPASTAVE